MISGSNQSGYGNGFPMTGGFNNNGVDWGQFLPQDGRIQNDFTADTANINPGVSFQGPVNAYPLQQEQFGMPGQQGQGLQGMDYNPYNNQMAGFGQASGVAQGAYPEMGNDAQSKAMAYYAERGLLGIAFEQIPPLDNSPVGITTGDALINRLHNNAVIHNMMEIQAQMQQDIRNGTRRRSIKDPNQLTKAQEAVIQRARQFEIDMVNLASLGFEKREIEFMCKAAYSMGYQMSPQKLVSAFRNLDYDRATKINYLFEICMGRKVVDTESPDDIAKHFRFMFGRHKRIGIQDLESSNISEIPRRVLIAGIPEGNFSLWNSNNYDTIEEMSYKVLSITGGNILIETDRIPVIKTEEGKKKSEQLVLDGVLEIKGPPENGIVQVSINKEHCRLCNRFVIVASMKRPDKHLGMREIICYEGTRVFIFADLVSGKSYTRYGTTTQRVYDFGYAENEITTKLTKVANRIYKKLHGVWKNDVYGNMEFEPYTETMKEEEDQSLKVE